MTLGEDFARALAGKDVDRIRALLHPQIDFRGLTPSHLWEAGDAETVIEEILRSWFEDTDEIEELVGLERGAYADRQSVGYRFRVRNPDGLHLVEQQAYYTAEGGRITWMRVVCGGYRPIDPPA